MRHATAAPGVGEAFELDEAGGPERIAPHIRRKAPQDKAAMELP